MRGRVPSVPRGVRHQRPGRARGGERGDFPSRTPLSRARPARPLSWTGAWADRYHPASVERVGRRQFLRMAFGGAIALAAGGTLVAALGRRAGRLRRVVRSAPAFGTTANLTVLAEDPVQGESAARAALHALREVEEALSLFLPGSEVCRLNRDGALEAAGPDLLAVLRVARRTWVASGGAFDVTVQPLYAAYAAARAAGRRPTEAEVDAARARVSSRALDVAGRAVRLAPGAAVTLNGLAQGHAADRVAAALRAHGIVHALVDTGEIGGLGRREDGRAWTAGIQHPRRADAFADLARLDGRFLSTSGDYATAFDAGFRDHHILDPRTGRSPPDAASVSVVAASGLLADALSTAAFAAGPEAGAALVAEAGAEALFILKDGRSFATPGFPRCDA